MNLSVVIDWLSKHASILIALLALFATFWQAYISRRHNRLSVKPHLEVARGCNFYKQQFYFTIQNNGLGPALVSSIRVFIDDVEVDFKNSERISDAISTLFYLYKYREHFMIISDSYMMKPDEEKDIINVVLDGDCLVQFVSDDVEKISSRVKVLVNYESIYGEKFECE